MVLTPAANKQTYSPTTPGGKGVSLCPLTAPPERGARRGVTRFMQHGVAPINFPVCQKCVTALAGTVGAGSQPTAPPERGARRGVTRFMRHGVAPINSLVCRKCVTALAGTVGTGSRLTAHGSRHTPQGDVRTRH
jgi:hypothetical protein